MQSNEAGAPPPHPYYPAQKASACESWRVRPTYAVKTGNVADLTDERRYHADCICEFQHEDVYASHLPFKPRDCIIQCEPKFCCYFQDSFEMVCAWSEDFVTKDPVDKAGEVLKTGRVGTI
eukprot:4375562-Amphidinium_carterae.1